VEEVGTTAGLALLRSPWQEIETSGPPVNPFLSWEWQYSWWETFGEKLGLRCLVVRSGDRPVGVVPLYFEEARPQLLRIGGGVDLSDHLGFVHCPGQAEEVVLAALDWLFPGGGPTEDGRREPLCLELHYLPDGAETLGALRSGAEQLGLRAELVQEEVSPQVELEGSFEAYLAERLNKKDRHELRRKLRRLDTERPGWRTVTLAELGLAAALDAFLALLRRSGSHKEAFLTDEVEAFIRRSSERLHQRGWLRIQFVEAGGELIAAAHGITVSGTWYLYNSGYDPALAALSPGLLCVAEGIRLALEEGCHRADLLRGSEGYKYHLGAQDRPLWRLQLTSATGGEACG
jgi:CelD/BcsL family acetyltransferase involved in cellulose biosynthesis